MLQFFKAVTAMSTGIFLLSVCTRLLPASVQEQHLSHAVPAAQNAAVLSSYFTGSAYQAPLFSMPAAEFYRDKRICCKHYCGNYLYYKHHANADSAVQTRIQSGIRFCPERD